MPDEFSPPPIREFADRGIKWLLETPENVRSLLRILAADIADHLDFSRLELLKTDFIPDNLRQQYADIVFLCPFRDTDGEREVVIVLLIEHQSRPDPIMAFRLLFYMVLIWDAQRRQWLDDKVPPSEWRFHPIVPLVFYTGTRTWTTGLDLAELMDLPEVLKPFVPRHETLFLNLSESRKEALVAEDRPWGWLMWVQQQIEKPLEELRPTLAEAVAHLNELPDEDRAAWAKALYYLVLLIYHRREEPEQAALLEVIQQTTSQRRRQEEIEEMGQTIAQTLITEGEARGRMLGEIRAKRNLVLRLLRRRFPAAPDRLVLHIEGLTDPRELDAWFDRVADAENLADLE